MNPRPFANALPSSLLWKTLSLVFRLARRQIALEQMSLERWIESSARKTLALSSIPPYLATLTRQAEIPLRAEMADAQKDIGFREERKQLVRVAFEYRRNCS